MEWTTIDYGDQDIRAMDFLDGVLVELCSGEVVGWPGYYIKYPTGDMDGPQLMPRKEHKAEFEIVVREK